MACEPYRYDNRCDAADEIVVVVDDDDGSVLAIDDGDKDVKDDDDEGLLLAYTEGTTIESGNNAFDWGLRRGRSRRVLSALMRCSVP